MGETINEADRFLLLLASKFQYGKANITTNAYTEEVLDADGIFGT
jgi:hypothetical protein